MIFSSILESLKTLKVTASDSFNTFQDKLEEQQAEYTKLKNNTSNEMNNLKKELLKFQSEAIDSDVNENFINDKIEHLKKRIDALDSSI